MAAPLTRRLLLECELVLLGTDSLTLIEGPREAFSKIRRCLVKLTDGVSIPLSWVFAAYVPTTGMVITALWWIFTVDSRLQRIEQRLGISSSVTAVDFVSSAKAGQ